VIDLELRLSEEADLYRLPHQRTSNLWLPEHFQKAYDRLAGEINAIGAQHVYVGLVPHVTIPPVSRGWGDVRDGYYEYYTRPWIWDTVFNPAKDARITREEARLIDRFIDEYNVAIRNIARRYGWIVVDLSGQFDRMAFRRSGGNPTYRWPLDAAEALRRNLKTAYLAGDDGAVSLDTRYLRLWDRKSPHAGLIRCGGIFSLDGVHLTTIGYGTIADSFLKAMADNGVRTVTDGTPALNWDRIVASDSLVTSPSPMLMELRSLLGFLSSRGTGNALLRLLEKFKGNV
jgi:hypothetical protein